MRTFAGGLYILAVQLALGGLFTWVAWPDLRYGMALVCTSAASFALGVGAEFIARAEDKRKATLKGPGR